MPPTVANVPLLPPGENGAPAKWLTTLITVAKHVISALMFLLCVIVSMTLVGSAFRAIIIWVLIVYLAALEGGQVAMVSLASIPRNSFSSSHKIASKCMRIVEGHGAMERYIMGRQFLVVIVIFVMSTVAAGSNTCDSIQLGVLSSLGSGVCSTGLTLTFVTIMVAQISSQIVASCCRLDFLNNYLMWINTRLALAIEYSGILHTVHLVKMLMAYFFVGPEDGSSEARNGVTNMSTLSSNSAAFWARVVLSLFLLWFSIVAIFHEILLGHTDSLGSAPGFVNMILVFLFMAIIGMYEGLQIALCALAHVDVAALRDRSPVAAANCELTFGSNLESFLIGRQMLVTVFVFFVAGTTTISESWKTNSDYTTFHLGDENLQKLISSGFPASLITTILGSLIFRIAAATNPIQFISNPIISPAIRICLAIESSGVMQFSWVLSKLFMQVFRFRRDATFQSANSEGTTNNHDLESPVDALEAILPIDVSSGESNLKRRGVIADEQQSSDGIPYSPTRDKREGSESLYRSIFNQEEDADGTSPPLPLSGDMGSPSVKESGHSVQQIYAATMMASPMVALGEGSTEFSYAVTPVDDCDDGEANRNEAQY